MKLEELTYKTSASEMTLIETLEIVDLKNSELLQYLQC